MSSSLRRGSQLLALALASSTVVVAAGASVASAAPTATTTTLYSGTANSSALQLILTLPDAAAPVTGALSSVLPNPIDLALIRTSGTVVHDGKASDEAAGSVADLAKSSLLTSSALSPALTPLLAHTVTSSLAIPNPAPYSATNQTAASNPLGLALAVTPLTAATDTGSKATSANGGVATSGLGSLATLVPATVLAPLTTVLSTATGALATATGAVAPVVTQVTSTVAPVTGAVAGALPVITLPVGPVTGGQNITVNPTTVTAAINNLGPSIQNLPALLQSVINDLLNGNVLSLKGLASDESVSPFGGTTTSSGSSNTGDISLLGGLIQVVASKASAAATAGGVAGKGSANATATLLKVQLGDDANTLLNVLATDQGLSAGALSGLPANDALQPVLSTINTALSTALGAVSTLLNSLSSSAQVLQQGTATHTASADGTHSEAHATPASVKVGIPMVSSNLLALSLGAVDVVANQEITTATPATVKAPSAPTVVKIPGKPAKPTAPSKKLAYTGADLPLTAGLALALLGAATVLTRRRRSNSGS